MNRVEILRTATAYLNARMFLKELREYEGVIPPDDYKALKQQALDGDVQGATIRLSKLAWQMDREG